jgi:hypothetical protein
MNFSNSMRVMLGYSDMAVSMNARRWKTSSVIDHLALGMGDILEW